MDYRGVGGEFLHLSEGGGRGHALAMAAGPTELTLIWNTGEPLELEVDGIALRLDHGQLVFLTEFHRVSPRSVESCRLVRFNRAFYCIIDHDSEVGCKGILFFGAAEVPVITIPDEEREKFEVLWRMFALEMGTGDALSLEMLQMMLKRLLILCTRLYKAQRGMRGAEAEQVDLIRQFNFLVETHFRSKRTVAEYAGLLHRAPKTLANTFAKLGRPSPQRMIHDRVMLEARRLLRYTDKPVQEVGFELGFEDVQAFSRFFRTQEGMAPTEYRSSLIIGG
jgi:AraC family transcriptional regulator, transcriptional activator of pobA